MRNPDQQNSMENATPGASEAFYSGALTRIRNFMLALAPVIAIIAAVKFGRHAALGFMLGCVISYLNFHWLKSGVAGLADKVTNTGKSQPGKEKIAGFLLRYALLGAAGYAILGGFAPRLGCLFAGVLLLVA